MIEERGLAAVAVGLLRPHMETIRPPRGLWVPFQFGRPLGEPCDPSFQHRVIERALSLLTRPDGPIVLDDFPDDPPGRHDQPGWKPPLYDLVSERHAPHGDHELQAAFRNELQSLGPSRQLAWTRLGRTTVGISGVRPEDWPDLAAQFWSGRAPDVPLQFRNAGVMLRLLADDIKAFYSEAAQSRGPFPSSRQIDTWFWNETAAGRLINRLRLWAMTSEVGSIRTVAMRFLVPARFQAEPFRHWSA